MMESSSKGMLPGYTGHIPYKNETIGLTTGEANKVSMAYYEQNSNKLGLAGQMMLTSRRASEAPQSMIQDFYKQQK